MYILFSLLFVIFNTMFRKRKLFIWRWLFFFHRLRNFLILPYIEYNIYYIYTSTEIFYYCSDILFNQTYSRYIFNFKIHIFNILIIKWPIQLYIFYCSVYIPIFFYNKLLSLINITIDILFWWSLVFVFLKKKSWSINNSL